VTLLLPQVLVLRELASSVPTFFFQQVQTFLDLIFNAVRDPKPAIREGAVEALRAALVATAQREMAKQAQKPSWLVGSVLPNYLINIIDFIRFNRRIKLKTMRINLAHIECFDCSGAE